MAVSQHTFAGSSDDSPILGGELSVLFLADDFLDRFPYFWQEATTSAAAAATQRLQESARNDPKWSAHADKLSVSYNGDGFSYDLTGTAEEHQAMRELEHGGPNGDPAPLIRTAASRDARHLSKDLEMRML